MVTLDNLYCDHFYLCPTKIIKTYCKRHFIPDIEFQDYGKVILSLKNNDAIKIAEIGKDIVNYDIDNKSIENKM